MVYGIKKQPPFRGVAKPKCKKTLNRRIDHEKKKMIQNSFVLSEQYSTLNLNCVLIPKIKYIKQGYI